MMLPLAASPGIMNISSMQFPGVPHIPLYGLYVIGNGIETYPIA